MAWIDACHGVGDDAGDGGEVEPFEGVFVAEQEGRGAVVDAGAVACGHRTAFTEDGFELGEAFEGGIGARMFVGGEGNRVTFALREHHRNNFICESAGCLGGLVFHLRIVGELILLFAGDFVFIGQIFSGFAHRVGMVEFAEGGVDEAPSEGGIDHFGEASECAVAFGLDERSAGHGFFAAGDVDGAFAEADAASCVDEGLQATGAEAVNGHAGDGGGQTCEQGGHAGDVAVVFACLVGCTGDDLFDGGKVEARIALNQCLDDQCKHVIGTDMAQTAGVAANGRADCVHDVGGFHGANLRINGEWKIENGELRTAKQSPKVNEVQRS